MECLGATLNQERLHAIDLQFGKQLRQHAGMDLTVGHVGEHNATRVGTTPLTHVEPRMVALGCDTPHEDGITLGTELVNQHLGERCAEPYRTIAVVEKAIGTLCPLQDNVGPMVGVDGDEAAVERQTFTLENT